MRFLKQKSSDAKVARVKTFALVRKSVNFHANAKVEISYMQNAFKC